MKFFQVILFLFVCVVFSVCCQAGEGFANYFLDETMRIDYYHVGDKDSEFFTIDCIYRQGSWAGNLEKTIDGFDNGNYYIKVYDAASKVLIFSKGFNCYFGEYQTTNDAALGIKRSYHESALLPYPKAKIVFAIEKRDRHNDFHRVFERVISPDAIEIHTETPSKDVKVFEIVKSGDPHQKVDLAFVAEGYTNAEEEKFKKQLTGIVKEFFEVEPYHANKKKFNIYGVFKPSQESGCDEPLRGVYKNTAVDASFNALGLSRYLLTEGNKAMRDIAAHVPYDALILMVNSKRYGGGGIYNSFCVFTAGSTEHMYLLIHEFGHSFAGLADEYYASNVAYNEFYPPGVEPAEPNITALLDPKKLKWQDVVSPGISIPTTWDKETYETFSMAYQKSRTELNNKITGLTRAGADAGKIAKLESELEALKQKNRIRTDKFLAAEPLAGKVGAFEGAGYTAKGLFRPMLNCIMFSAGVKPYCKVCQAAVSRVIEHYSI